MPPQIIGGVIAGVGAIGGTILGNKGVSSAAKASAAASDRSADVVERNYDRSAQALAPWQQSGLAANSQINALLGLAPQQQQTPTPQPNAMAQYYGGPAFMGSDQMSGFDGSFASPFGGMWQAPPTTPPINPNAPTQQTAENAFDVFRNSTGYKFRLGEGMNAINSGYAGAGTLQSGAAMKAINEYGQNFASNEFGNYMGALGNQQQTGFRAAAAQAGVSADAGNSLADIYQNQGNNAANAALLKAQNTGQLINTFGKIGAGFLGGR